MSAKFPRGGEVGYIWPIVYSGEKTLALSPVISQKIYRIICFIDNKTPFLYVTKSIFQINQIHSGYTCYLFSFLLMIITNLRFYKCMLWPINKMYQIFHVASVHFSRLMTKPTKWHVRPAKTQISLGIRPIWSEFSLCAQWVAKEPDLLHADSEDSDQTGRMPRLIWVFAERTAPLLILSRGGSFMSFMTIVMVLQQNVRIIMANPPYLPDMPWLNAYIYTCYTCTATIGHIIGMIIINKSPLAIFKGIIMTPIGDIYRNCHYVLTILNVLFPCWGKDSWIFILSTG